MAGYTPAEMRKAFHQLNKIRSEILSISGPKRAARDAFVNEAREEERRLDAEIKEIEKDLAEISNQLGALSRALNYKVGSSEAEE